MAFSVRAARRVSRGTDDETVFRTRYVKCSGSADADVASRSKSSISSGDPTAMIRTDKERKWKREERENEGSVEIGDATIDTTNLEGDIDCCERRSNRIGRGREGVHMQSMTVTRTR